MTRLVPQEAVEEEEERHCYASEGRFKQEQSQNLASKPGSVLPDPKGMLPINVTSLLSIQLIVFITRRYLSGLISYGICIYLFIHHYAPNFSWRGSPLIPDK